MPISQPAVSQHLKVLREASLVSVRAMGTRRIYALDQAGLDADQAWLCGDDGFPWLGHRYGRHDLLLVVGGVSAVVIGGGEGRRDGPLRHSAMMGRPTSR